MTAGRCERDSVGQQRSRVRLQPLAIGGALDLVGVGEDRLHRPELPDQVARALLPDAGHAGDVVDGVPHQGQDVHHALGRHAELLLHHLAVVHHRPRAFAAGVQDQDVVAHQLQQVLVARDHHDFVSRRHRLRGRAAMTSRPRTRRVVMGSPRPRSPPHVRHCTRGRPPSPAVRLVLAVLLVAEVGRRGRGRRRPLRVLVLVQLPQHRREAVDGVAGQAPRRREPLDGEVGTVELGASVDEVDRVLAAHGSILLIESGLHEPSRAGPPCRRRASRLRRLRVRA